MKTIIAFLSLLLSMISHAEEKAVKKQWFEKFSIRGYAQLRFTAPKETITNENDRSVGNNSNLILRRARIIISGETSDNVFIYIQPDFGTAVGDTQFVPQLRDFYADLFLDQHKHYRIRAGLSKVPYGFDNPQSSQNRLTFDRSDAMNTAVKDERDLGIFLYWETEEIRARFRELVDSGLKGSGDYGIVGFGFYNGQTLAKREGNNNMHTVLRFSYPLKLESGQFFEFGMSGYSGAYEVTKSTTAIPTGGINVPDQRVAAHAVWYPQPLGFQAEYNVGQGPELSGSTIIAKPLRGGYLQAMYKFDHCIGDTFIPFARYQYYQGGRKADTNAPRNFIRETEIGAELQFSKSVELTAAYNLTYRTNAGANLGRLQLQWNF